MRRQIVRTIALLLAIGFVAAPARADDHGRDQDTVRQAVERGEIKALADILSAIRDKLPGDVIGIEIERKNGRWFYELRVRCVGHLFEVLDTHRRDRSIGKNDARAACRG
jgi:uncharacterized membrane protein YkoI